MIRRSTLLAAIAILVLSGLIACSSGPQPIEYGSDSCARCKMIISQRKFGAELITTKGRIYKYDAIECLIPEFLRNGADYYSHMLVTDYNQPGKLIDATSSSYLISKSLPSPMGAFLSAHATSEKAIEVEQIYEGEVFDWNSLVSTFKEEMTSIE